MLVRVGAHAPREVIDLIVIRVVGVGEPDQQIIQEGEIPRVRLNNWPICSTAHSNRLDALTA